MADNRRALPYVFDAPSAAAGETAATAEPVAPTTDVPMDVLNTPVEMLELSIRTANCLQNANVQYIGELVQMSEQDLLRTKNFGRRGLTELGELLADLGLRFGMNLGSWQAPQS